MRNFLTSKRLISLIFMMIFSCAFGSAFADAEETFYFMWPIASGSWDSHVTSDTYTNYGDYWQCWDRGDEPYYNDYTIYTMGGYRSGEIADFLAGESLGSAEIIAQHDGVYLGNVMIYPERLRIDGKNYQLTALHSPEGGDDILLDGGWYDRGEGWEYEGEWPGSIGKVKWIIIPDSIKTIYNLCRGFKNFVGISLPENEQFSMYIAPELAEHSPGVVFYVVEGSRAHQCCIEKGYPYRLRESYVNYIRQDSPSGIRIFDLDRYLKALSSIDSTSINYTSIDSKSTDPSSINPNAVPDNVISSVEAGKQGLSDATSRQNSWPESTSKPIPVSMYSLSNDERYQSRCGPDRSYHGAGAYKTYKMISTKALFIEGNYALIDLDYTTVGRRCVYFRTKCFKSLEKVPEVTLQGFPAETTTSLTPRFGPGNLYDSFDEAKISAQTSLNVFFEDQGWVFAEFECGLGVVRAWIPAEQVKER